MPASASGVGRPLDIRGQGHEGPSKVLAAGCEIDRILPAVPIDQSVLHGLREPAEMLLRGVLHMGQDQQLKEADPRVRVVRKDRVCVGVGESSKRFRGPINRNVG